MRLKNFSHTIRDSVGTRIVSAGLMEAQRGKLVACVDFLFGCTQWRGWRWGSDVVVEDILVTDATAYIVRVLRHQRRYPSSSHLVYIGRARLKSRTAQQTPLLSLSTHRRNDLLTPRFYHPPHWAIRLCCDCPWPDSLLSLPALSLQRRSLRSCRILRNLVFTLHHRRCHLGHSYQLVYDWICL